MHASRGGEAPADRLEIWSRVPDLLSLLRMLLIGGYVLLLEDARDAALTGPAADASALPALAVALIIAATDLLDGFIARRVFDEPRRFGAVLDAVADRLFQWTAVLYLAFRTSPVFTAVPEWLVAVMAVRELLLAGILFRRRRRGMPSLAHAGHGKSATASIFLLVILATAGAPDAVVITMSVVTATLVVWSTGAYVRALW